MDSIKENYDDKEVCKYNLVSVCPHDLFPNTKCDLGICPKRHEDYFRDLFLQDENRFQNERRYINETINLFESLLVGIDSKIKKAQSKLEQSIGDTEQPQELLEKLDAIDAEIKKRLVDAESLGDEGKIEESEECMAQVEALRKRKEEIKLEGDLNASNRQMKICDICGAMQAINDIDKISQAHLEGKLHTGFAILRRDLESMKKRREELKNLDMSNKSKEESFLDNLDKKLNLDD